MNRIALTAASLFAALFFKAAAEDVDYTDGFFIVNEDWYGHQNSTVNYFQPDNPDGDYWHYRVIQAENPGKELGCTNQYGAIWDDRFYLIAKQDKDPGADVTGGRISVTDARTMKLIGQLQLIDPSGKQCDGRAFTGVNSRKGYVSTSNGIWVLDLARSKDRWKDPPIQTWMRRMTNLIPIHQARCITDRQAPWYWPKEKSLPCTSSMECLS